ncbi:MAG TPA: cobalamin-binding protein [Acidobacteriaceae bacterium]|jgi:iron complex transport system substrate-binding protein|nr:cobalamin-binding protein [Acidobacteriaceae bacterium]
MRVCSLLPSATEMLFAMGAGEDVAAVTFECDYPKAARTRPQVVFSRMPEGLAPAEIDALVRETGAEGRSLYFADFELLEELAPDLIVLQDLCRVCAIDSPTLARDLSRLGSRPRVISLNASSLEGVFGEIELLGEAVGRAEGARELVRGLRERVERVRRSVSPAALRPKVLCLEWLDPLFQAGHWVPEMVAIAGGDPVLATPAEKSVRITWEQIAAAQPEIVVAMPCGYHLEETIAQFQAAAAGYPAAWRELPAVAEGRVYAVDGSAYFSRPGPRLVDGLEILGAIVSGSGWERLPRESVARLT